MNKHLKCFLKVLGLLPLLFLAFCTLPIQIFVMAFMSFISSAGCINYDLPEPWLVDIIVWYRSL